MNSNTDLTQQGTGKITQSATAGTNSMGAITMNSNTNLTQSGTGIVSQSGTGANLMKQITMNANTDIVFSAGTGKINQLAQSPTNTNYMTNIYQFDGANIEQAFTNSSQFNSLGSTQYAGYFKLLPDPYGTAFLSQILFQKDIYTDWGYINFNNTDNALVLYSNPSVAVNGIKLNGTTTIATNVEINSSNISLNSGADIVFTATTGRINQTAVTAGTANKLKKSDFSGDINVTGDINGTQNLTITGDISSKALYTTQLASITPTSAGSNITGVDNTNVLVYTLVVPASYSNTIQFKTPISANLSVTLIATNPATISSYSIDITFSNYIFEIFKDGVSWLVVNPALQDGTSALTKTYNESTSFSSPKTSTAESFNSDFYCNFTPTNQGSSSTYTVYFRGLVTLSAPYSVVNISSFSSITSGFKINIPTAVSTSSFNNTPTVGTPFSTVNYTETSSISVTGTVYTNDLISETISVSSIVILTSSTYNSLANAYVVNTSNLYSTYYINGGGTVYIKFDGLSSTYDGFRFTFLKSASNTISYNKGTLTNYYSVDRSAAPDTRTGYNQQFIYFHNFNSLGTTVFMIANNT